MLRGSLMLFLCTMAAAQFRGGSISWEPVPSVGPNVVRFTVRRCVSVLLLQFGDAHLRCLLLHLELT